MLIKNLYTIQDFKTEALDIKASILIHKENDIFKGHFPNNPVMPGVCMIQIIKELSEKALNCKLFMQKASNIKFMALINPEENPNLKLEISITEVEGLYRVKNSTYLGDTNAMKFSGTFKKNQQ